MCRRGRVSKRTVCAIDLLLLVVVVVVFIFLFLFVIVVSSQIRRSAAGRSTDVSTRQARLSSHSVVIG